MKELNQMLQLYHRYKYTVFFIVLFLFSQAFGQTKFNLKGEKSSKIHFQLIDNLIIIPIELNGIELSFVLDTGVSKPILFNLTNIDSLKIKQTKKIFLRGLGANGSIEALRSRRNFMKFGEAANPSQDIYVVFDESINFSPRLGIPVHGIIGYDIFKDFVVELNYSNKFIRLHNPQFFEYKTSKKWQTLPLEIYQNKPFINANVELHSKAIPVKLLIDSGGSDALWLFRDDEKGIKPIEDKQFKDFLGIGLSGDVHGTRSKLPVFSLKNYHLKNVNVAYPDSTDLSIALHHKERNGSIGGNILKRFNMFIDYGNRKIQFRKNNNFSAPFYYNNSGIVLEHNGVRAVRKKNTKINANPFGTPSRTASDNTISLVNSYSIALIPSYEIVQLREHSNAKAAGLEVGDIIISINSKDASSLSLQDINNLLHDKEGKTMRLRVERNGIEHYFKFKLDNVFN